MNLFGIKFVGINGENAHKLLFTVVDCIDNATMYTYMALASCHYEGNTTYAGPYLAKLTGKDERAIRLHLSDLEVLGLIRRRR